jgi:hypothetical protein
MPRGEIVATQVARGGVAEPAQTSGDAANGHLIQNDGRVVLRVVNADGAATHTITFEIPGSIDVVAIPDPVTTLAISAVAQWFGPWPVTLYDQPGSNQLWIDVDSSQVKIQALRIPM